MRYPGILLLTGLLATSICTGASNQAYDIYSEGNHGVVRQADKIGQAFVVTKQQITPVSGNMPIFNESVIDDQKLLDQVLTITSESLGQNYVSPIKPDSSDQSSQSEDLNPFSMYENNNIEIQNEDFTDIAPEGTAEILIYERIRAYSELVVLEEKLEDEEKAGKVISEEQYMEAVENLQQIDEQIATQVEEKAGDFIDRFINFIGKKAKKGDILALTATVMGIREYIEGKIENNPDEKLELFVHFLKKVERTGVLIAQLMDEDNTFRKYYILYLIVNNIFINDYKPMFEMQETASVPENNQTSEVSVSHDVSVSDNDQEADDENTAQVVQTPINNVQDVEPEDTEDYTLSRNIVFERLIENFEFESQTTMSQRDIQEFLERKGSCLKNPYRGTYPSEIIYSVCREYGINPKLMLVTFQKEQSLISRRSASESTLDWALGVGCYDNGTKNSRYRGFEKQIASAARIYRHWFDDGKNIDVTENGYRMKVNYGTTYQYMENEASYSLYRYTPHTVDIHLNVRGGGNYLFGQIYINYWGGFLKK